MENETQNQVIKLERTNAKRRIGNAIEALRDALNEVERKMGLGHDFSGIADNMGRSVAVIAHQAGKLDVLEQFEKIQQEEEED